MKILFPALVLLAVLFSCKSNARSNIQKMPQDAPSPAKLTEEAGSQSSAPSDQDSLFSLEDEEFSPLFPDEADQPQAIEQDFSAAAGEDESILAAEEIPAPERGDDREAEAEPDSAEAPAEEKPEPAAAGIANESSRASPPLIPETQSLVLSPRQETQVPPAVVIVRPQAVEPPPAASQQTPPPPVSREPPQPPSFLRPAEPVIPPPVREPVPVPLNPLPELPSRQIPETGDEKIVFSRIVRATVGQMIEIPFRGTGWVYLGELGNRRGIGYDSRRLDITQGTSSSPGFIEGQSFIFRAEATGTYILKFYKQDFIQDYIINDYVQVIVGDAPETLGGRFGSPVDRGRVIAEPRWPAVPGTQSEAQGSSSAGGTDTAVGTSPVAGAVSSAGASTGTASAETRETPSAVTSPAAAAQSNSPAAETRPAAPVIIVPETQSPAPPAITLRPRQSSGDDGIVPVAPPQAALLPELRQQELSPAELLQSNASPAEFVRRAKMEFDAGRVESALTILDAMKQRYPAGTDEAWWLYGQLLEANSSSRDVRLALEYYRRLVREYPQSSRAGDAQRRIAYLERYYFNIR